jgi:hypothetical protein
MVEKLHPMKLAIWVRNILPFLSNFTPKKCTSVISISSVEFMHTFWIGLDWIVQTSELAVACLDRGMLKCG